MRFAKLQSAMEYLMTYGWSILLIAIVIAAIFELGVFNNNPLTSSNTCLAQSGFLCTKPQLNATGVLNVTFGQSYGTTYTITGVACTNSTAGAPSSFVSIGSIPYYTGQPKQLTFQCPLTSGVIGTSFSGVLWIQYNTPTLSGQTAKIGIVNAKVATSNPQGLSSYTTLLSVPITLTNLQSSSTGSNFQEMLTINSNQYSSYINGNWMNVEFTTNNAAAGSPGTPLQAWVESGATNTATNTIVWVNLPSGIPATSSLTIYMDILANNAMSASGPTGEAPQLSPNYAQYDNGASVFTFYDNFAGNTLSSSWGQQLVNIMGDLGSLTVSNGLTVSSGLGGRGFIYTQSSFPQNTWFEADITSVPSNTYSGIMGSTSQQNYGYMFTTLTSSVTWQDPGVGPVDLSSPNLQLSTGIMGVSYSSASTQTYNKNYVYTSASYSYGGSGSMYYALGNFYGQYYSTSAQWVRVRAYPPNDAMPGEGSGIALPSQVIHYVPITLTNSQNASVSQNTQIMIQLNALSYTSNEALNLQNIEFFYNNGTVIPSWLEGNLLNEAQTTNLNTVANVVYWLKIAPSIAAGGTKIVYAGFAPTSTNLFSATVGEAPQLSSTYAQYDNGGTIFSYYQRWGGLSSLPAGWTAYSSPSITYSATYTSLISAISGTREFMVEANPTVAPAVVEFGGDFYDPELGGNSNQFGYMGNPGDTGSSAITLLNPDEYASFYLSLLWNAGARASTGVNPANSVLAYSISAPNYSIGSAFYEYSLKNTIPGNNPNTHSYPLNYVMFMSTSVAYPMQIYWLRTRVYPPNGVLPSWSFGSFT